MFGEFYYIVQNAEVGDIIRFGSYEQDNDPSNGQEEIEWIVLEKDGKAILLISKYALDCLPYNTTLTNVTWENCSLRRWLNATFFNEAFSSEERKIIISSTVTPEGNPSFDISGGNYTIDKVFILSLAELDKYSILVGADQYQGTEYCFAQGAFNYYRNGKTLLWVRTPGRESNRDIYVYDGWTEDNTGMYYGAEVNTDNIAFRPALRIGF